MNRKYDGLMGMYLTVHSSELRPLTREFDCSPLYSKYIVGCTPGRVADTDEVRAALLPYFIDDQGGEQ